MSFEVTVRAIRQEADRIRSFEFCMADGSSVSPYPAGSSLTLQLPNGVMRTYSLLDSGTLPEALRIAVLYQGAGRGGSRFLHENVREGDHLHVNNLSMSFEALLTPAKHILIAGGIGITPILSLARYFFEHGQQFNLHYGASAPDQAAFVEELLLSPFGGSVSIYYSSTGNRMNIGALLSERADGAHLYCCGPSGMMSTVAAASAHWPNGTVHFDSFEPSVADDAGRPFKIKLKSSGEVIDIPADQTILAVLKQRGITVSSQCGQGHCGSCLTPVLEGKPEHRDRVLSNDERAANDLMALCCSRSLSDLLVLDL